ncbi:unnamed protein product [Cochlearia groenlandica]
MADVADKLSHCQASTGLEDADLCTDILQSHGRDLEIAASSYSGVDHGVSRHELTDYPYAGVFDGADHGGDGRDPGSAWRIITLPISIVSGSLGLVYGAIGLGFCAASGVLLYSLGMFRFGSRRVLRGRGRGGSQSSSSPTAEAAEFAATFDREYAVDFKPSFVREAFMDAIQRSRSSRKLLFVYLHSPDHPDTLGFCEGTLGNEAFASFLDENFVSWGGNIRASEGFNISNSLRAWRFPFCAVVMPSSDQRIALLLQVEGTRTPEEMLALLQRVMEDSSHVLVTDRVEAEERRNNILRLREEQDAPYRAALEADQVRERERREEEERLEREGAEAEKKRKEEEEAKEREEREATESEAARARMRQEKAIALGDEPDKGPDVTHVLMRFPPNGERKSRRFQSKDKIQSLYDYVDSLGVLETEEYSLISTFPREVYGRDKLSMSLKDTALHPQASLFIELN